MSLISEDVFFKWLSNNDSFKRDSTKRKVAYWMTCLIDLYMENGGDKVSPEQLYAKANTNKPAFYYATGGVKKLWILILTGVTDHADDLTSQQKVVMKNIFLNINDHEDFCSELAGNLDVIGVEEMDYPSALSLMIRHGYCMHRNEWGSGYVSIDSGKMLFKAPDGTTVEWCPSMPDQLATDWAVYQF
ncbi:MAG: Thoeris anti-defense Tad2 family protein [Plesiomonas sp.]|uniref:Thoeris anti-defense Tad2 family protein n=1 Tax=Plesiomonas sp. TaxID=2486279 RepID=UPI003F314252